MEPVRTAGTLNRASTSTEIGGLSSRAAGSAWTFRRKSTRSWRGSESTCPTLSTTSGKSTYEKPRHALLGLFEKICGALPEQRVRGPLRSTGSAARRLLDHRRLGSRSSGEAETSEERSTTNSTATTLLLRPCFPKRRPTSQGLRP